MLSHKTRRGLVLLAAVAGGALLVLARNGVPPPRQWPAAQGQMVCGTGVALCGVLTLQTGLGEGVYSHPTPSVHGLWPEVAPYGTSECAKPTISTADPRRVVQCYGATGEGTAHIIEFETHEWEKHGECAGVRDARAYLTTICGLAEQPLQAMTAARKAGGGLDSARRAVMGLGLEIFAVDEQHSQLLLSACSDGDTWTLSPVEKFPEACGRSTRRWRRPLWAVLVALALVFYVLVRAGTDPPPAPETKPPAGLTKQQLALLEAGDKPSTGEKPSPPSSTTTWSEIAPPSVSSSESWAEVEAVAPAPTLAGVDREPEDINKQRELFQQIQKRAQAIPAKPSFTPMDAAAHKAAHELQQRLWPRNGWPKDLSVEERTAFSHKIYRIKQEELGVLVAKLDAMCPDAIDKTTKEEIEISIDMIDAHTFRELDRYVRECLAKKPRILTALDMMQ